MEDYLLANPWLIVVIGVMGWSVVLSLIARLSGWSLLAEYYEAADAYDGPRRRFQSISMERLKFVPSNYGGVVEFGADARGLHISLFILFRPFHPPLVIPWSDLKVETRQVLMWTQAVLIAARAPEVKIMVPGPTAQWIAMQSGGVFAFESEPRPVAADMVKNSVKSQKA